MYSKININLFRDKCLSSMQSYVIHKTMQDVKYPTTDNTAGCNREELMNRHIAEYNEYLIVFKSLTKKVRDGTNFTWITVSIKPSASCKSFVKDAAAFAKKKYVDKFFYVFEQRGEREETQGYGVHLHMVASYRKMIYLNEFERNIHRHFAEYAVDKAIWIKHIIHEFIEDKVNYMCGDKFDTKLGKVSQDRIWRIKNHLQDYYTNDLFFFVENGKARPHADATEGSSRKRVNKEREEDHPE